MKKQLSFISLGIALLSSVPAISQDEKKVIPCGTYEAMEAHFEQDPEARKAYEAKQKALQDKFENEKSKGHKSAAVQYTIPTVFHILHQGGAENIDDQEVIDAVNWVNDDLAKAHGDASLTAAPFSSLYINSDIKLMLAKKDPNGNCTSGIIHHFDAKTNWGQGPAAQDSYWPYTWNPTKYLNIYVVASIAPQNTVVGGGIIVGYTYKPGTWNTGNPHDAIVYRYDYLDGLEARSLTHELGHWLNLSHTWGNTNQPGVSCGNDGLADTPLTKGQFNGCPSSLSGNTCDASGTDNVQNIMNYASCPINFTTDQTNAMRSALTSNVSGRESVISATNLAATDVNNTVSCAPVADFLSSNLNYTVCAGQALTMKSTSYNGTISAYAWEATNSGSVAAPTASSTNITFPNSGTAVVTLTVTNASGSSTFTRNVYVINNPVVIGNFYVEDFETAGTPANWTIVNGNAGSTTWQQTNAGAFSNASAFLLDGTIAPANQMDYLVMPPVNPQANPGNELSFWYAYARYSNSNNDKLELQASTNCGGTWTIIKAWGAAALANGSGGVSTTPYIPAANEWKLAVVSNDPISPDYAPGFSNMFAYSNVIFRFMFQEDLGGVGFGNRFYLDYVKFADPNGISELTKNLSFSIHPNPSSGEVTVNVNAQDAANVSVQVSDLLGREALPATQHNLTPGEHRIAVNQQQTLGKGVYFITVGYNGAKISRKLVIQ